MRFSSANGENPHRLYRPFDRCDTRRRCDLPQVPYIQEHMEMDIESCISKPTVCNPTDLRIAYRQAIGSFIWPHRSRPDIGYPAATLSKSTVAECRSPYDARGIWRGYSKIAKFSRRRHRKIHYARLDIATQWDVKMQKITECRIIFYSAA